MNRAAVSRVLMPAAALACLTPWVPSALALLSGVFFAVILENPYADFTRRQTHRLLTWSVMGLGCGMNLMVVAEVGLHGLGYTVVGILFTLGLGWMLGRWLRLERESAILISVGTAICGGSAIAAVGPVIRAKSHSMSVALGTVFFFNALALLAFPPLGKALNLSQSQFGLWSALAIHDTSSVVGSALQYGAESLQIATTVKLARALWIVPVAVAIGWLVARGQQRAGGNRPWFILGFVIAAAIVTWIPAAGPAGHIIEAVAKRTLVLTLFFIGANLSRDTLRAVGFVPLIQGFLLWVIVAGATLGGVLGGWIQ
jgi:uncharacterized integral membrane protein (TIGR00698 family)